MEKKSPFPITDKLIRVSHSVYKTMEIFHLLTLRGPQI